MKVTPGTAAAVGATAVVVVFVIEVTSAVAERYATTVCALVSLKVRMM